MTRLVSDEDVERAADVAPPTRAPTYAVGRANRGLVKASLVVGLRPEFEGDLVRFPIADALVPPPADDEKEHACRTRFLPVPRP